MATINPSEGVDSKSIGSAPPSYDRAVASSASAQSFSLSSLFSFLLIKPKRTVVLSRIRDIVLTPNITPSSISIVNACAADLTTKAFSKLLQTPNIEGHSALYWAIVNNQRQVLLAFAPYISECSPACSSELRLACMITSDHASFMQLKLADIDAKGEALRRALGCPPDEMEVHETVKVGNDHQFVASFCIKMFQKRLRITHKLRYEFVVGGRIWRFGFEMDTVKWTWCMGYSLSEPSLPVCSKGSYRIENSKVPSCPFEGRSPKFAETLVPKE
ncbi:hypothetical protein P692DRAFT_20907743 [Suillus brevipes Sb2]|nr:hypothetical protein P692DRAFT_20907743 [Suillus brevipes Sb2]